MPRQPRPKQPLGEVFGFPADNLSPEAEDYRRKRLCPFNNKVLECTKDKADDPLGVCSINHDGGMVITCPVRFRQDWRITRDAANFFFPAGTPWISLVEVGLRDGEGLAAGNIDVVLASYDEQGRLTDFGALEVQAVYISGNVRKPFAYYMQNRGAEIAMDWSGMKLYPRPDYLSSSRKRLAPQLLYKGSILKAWGKKQAVAIQNGFYRTLPALPQVPEHQADIMWLIYDLEHDTATQSVALVLRDRIYSRFEPALDRMTKPGVGPIADFTGALQARLDAQLSSLPAAPTHRDAAADDMIDPDDV